MQTITLNVKDDFVPKFMDLLQELKDNVTFQSDENLDLDPYFYDRQKKLKKLVSDVEEGSEKVYDFENSMDELINELENSA